LLVFTFAVSEHLQVLVQHIAGFYKMYFKQVPETISFGYQRNITSKKHVVLYMLKFSWQI
jgi:hypothetical protein